MQYVYKNIHKDCQTLGQNSKPAGLVTITSQCPVYQYKQELLLPGC